MNCVSGLHVVSMFTGTNVKTQLKYNYIYSAQQNLKNYIYTPFQLSEITKVMNELTLDWL